MPTKSSVGNTIPSGQKEFLVNIWVSTYH